MNLKDPKYDGKGGLWKQHHPKIAAQGNIQIGGRVIALTIWHNNKGGSAPEYTISVNEQKTGHEEMCWFKSLSIDSKPTRTQPAVPPHPDWKPPKIVGRKADILIVDDLDDDIPF